PPPSPLLPYTTLFRSANAPKRLLSGLVRCGTCGWAMNTMGPDRRWRCTNRMRRGPQACANARTVPSAAAEAEVLERLQRDLLHPDRKSTRLNSSHQII